MHEAASYCAFIAVENPQIKWPPLGTIILLALGNLILSNTEVTPKVIGIFIGATLLKLYLTI